MSFKTLPKQDICSFFSFAKTFTSNTFWYTQYSVWSIVHKKYFRFIFRFSQNSFSESLRNCSYILESIMFREVIQ